MTRELLAWLARIREKYVPYPGRVLEVGSYNVNGSAREHFQSGSESYLGVDQTAGPGVDRVMSSHELNRQLNSQFDTIVCCEMLEHDSNPLHSVAEMRKLLAPGGHLIVTSPANGFPEHRYPRDYWRLMPDAYEDIIFKNMTILDRLIHLGPAPGCNAYLGQNTEVRIFQAYFDKSSGASLDRDSIPYYNPTCGKFFESQIICDLFSQCMHAGSAYFGLVSWRIKSKLNGTPDYRRTIEADHFEHDFYVPVTAAGMEVWQVAVCLHGETILRVARDLIRILGFALPDLCHLGGIQPTCNYQVCRTDLYQEFVEKMLKPAIEIMQDSRNPEFQAILHQDSLYRGSMSPARLTEIFGVSHYGLHPFLCERLFPTYAAIKKWRGIRVPILQHQVPLNQPASSF